VVNTLRAWGVRMDETFFLGGIDKAPVLEALRPHIFFDDQLTHLREAQRRVPSAHVVPERQQLALFDDEQVVAPVPAAPLVVLPPRARPEAAAEASPATRPAAAPTEPLPGLVDLSGAASRSARRG
jgi:hypothetical protein